METLITSLPTTAYGWIGLVAFCVFVVAQLVLLVRLNQIKLLRQSNDDLRDALEDKGREIDELKDQMLIVKTRMVELENNNGHLETLILKALGDYFSANPTVARALKQARRKDKDL